jgi:hypothetical protein
MAGLFFALTSYAGDVAITEHRPLAASGNPQRVAVGIVGPGLFRFVACIPGS